jgi:adenosylcobinamide-GDP ribazoletransferase
VATVLLAGAVGWSTYGLGGVVAAVLALAAGAAYAWHCVRRFGGITGDVLGACVEVTGTATLVFLGFL